jgi:hypothetical protein
MLAGRRPLVSASRPLRAPDGALIEEARHWPAPPSRRGFPNYSTQKKQHSSLSVDTCTERMRLAVLVNQVIQSQVNQFKDQT